MLKSILQPYNNFKFSSFDLGFLDKINPVEQTPNAPVTHEVLPNEISQTLRKIRALRNQSKKVTNGYDKGVRDIAEKQKAAKLGTVQESIDNDSLETSQWSEQAIENGVQANLERAITKGMTEQQLRETLTAQAIANLTRINQRIEELNTQKEQIQSSDSLLRDLQQRKSAKMSSRISELEAGYIGSELERNDKKIELDEFVIPNLKGGYINIQVKQLMELSELYGDGLESKIEEWKSIYSKNQEDKILQAEERNLVSSIQKDIHSAIEQSPILATALRSILSELSQNENIKEGSNDLGLEQWQNENFLKKLNSNLSDSLYYLMEESKGAVYQLDEWSNKIQIPKLIEENIVFRIAVESQTKINAQPKITASEQKLSEDWDRQIGPRMEKARINQTKQVV
jgi:hypothetical protein